MPVFKETAFSDSGSVTNPFYIKYGVPVLLCVIATIIKLWLTDHIGFKTPFLLYFGVIVVTSKYFGKKSAIVVTILSAVAAQFFFISPLNLLDFNRDSTFQLTLFILECALIISMSTALTNAVNIISENDIRFKALVEKSSEGIVTIDVDGRFSYCSPSVHNILGYTDEEFLKLPSWQLLHQDETLEIKEQFFRFASHADQTSIFLHQMRHKNGNWLWIESKMTNLLNEAPINAIIANFSDVTERVMDETLREDFISIASHELKTPLTSLKAYTQLLQSRFKNGTDESSLTIINKIDLQVNKVIQMVTSLLDVTALQQNKLSLNIESFNLNVMITDLVDTMQQTHKKYYINTSLTPLNIIWADKERLGQVITNMLSNAIKYSPDADLVDLATHIEDDNLIISVKDYGIGIPEQDLSKVFERFYRVDGAKSKYQGLGLGLFICRQIIEQHGGKIGAISREGKGSTFWASLPMAQIIN